MTDYEKFENECKKIREENKELLSIFTTYLEESGISSKTIRKHISNVDLYINDFLLYYEPITASDGIPLINQFLGDFYIHKCMWSTPNNIKTTSTSIKKFYKCMLENNKIEKIDYKWLCTEIKENMDEWQSDCADFNEPFDDDDSFDEFF